MLVDFGECLEAVAKGVVSGKNPARKLRTKPAEIKKLSDYFDLGSSLFQMGLTIHPLTEKTFLYSHAQRLSHGLLVNDSLSVACMQEIGVSSMASHDADFAQSVADLAI